MTAVIDAYAHCGLRKYRPIEDVRRMRERLGIERTVLVQHLGEFDNSYIEGIVAEGPGHFAGCFVIDTEAEDASEELARWAERKVFRGIRMLAHTLETHGELWEEAVGYGLNVIAYEQPTLGAHVEGLSRFFGEHPEGRLIVSHLGVLDRGESPAFPTFDRTLALAELPNAYMQVSGMHMFGEHPYREQAVLVRRALEAFGAERLLYGSNYPLMGDDAGHQRELGLLLAGELGVPNEAIEQVVYGTARELWFDR